MPGSTPITRRRLLGATATAVQMVLTHESGVRVVIALN